MADDAQLVVYGELETRAAFVRYRSDSDDLEAGRAPRELARRLVSRLQAATASQSDARARRLASTVRTSAGSSPGLSVGGTARVVSRGTANDIVYGVNYGARRTTPGGFRPPRSSGYWIDPTLEREDALVNDTFDDELDAMARSWGR